MQQYRIGLVINPWAGIGGSVALKGSDGQDTVVEALARGATPKATERVKQMLGALLSDVPDLADQVEFLTGEGVLGSDLLVELNLPHKVMYSPVTDDQTSADDSRALAQAIGDRRADLLLFAGGDGTARDIAAVYPESLPVLGIPAGVKIHSGVYAVSPRAAAKVVAQLLAGALTSVREADVMDIDEDAFRQGTVRARRFGEMLIPSDLTYVQAVKMSGKESDELVLADIAAEILERMDTEADALWLMGSGSTVAAIMQEGHMPNTLLGVDAVYQGQVIKTDATAQQLLELMQRYPQTYLVITVIGGQGHLLGRGNQQLSPQLLRAIDRKNLLVVATKAKLNALGDRPLHVDSGDPELDRQFSGLQRIITGYRDEVLKAVAAV